LGALLLRGGERRGVEGSGGKGRGGKGKEGGKGNGRTTAIPNFFRPWFSNVFVQSNEKKHVTRDTDP